MKFQVRKTYDARITNRETLIEAIKSFGLNYCKASERLKADPELEKLAIRHDPFAIQYMKDAPEEVKRLALERNEYLSKYTDPLGDIIDFSKPLSENDMRILRFADGEQIVEEDKKLTDSINTLNEIQNAMREYIR